MPTTFRQRCVFSVLMAFAMVYGMELYNQALLAGGLSTRLFLAPFADILPLMAAVIAREAVGRPPRPSGARAPVLRGHTRS